MKTLSRTAVVDAVRVQLRVAPVQCAVLVGLTVLTGVSAPGVAWLIKSLLDAIADRDSARSLMTLAIALVAAQALMTASLYVTSYVMASAGQRLTVALESRLFRRVARLRGLRHFEDPPFLDRLQLAGQGVERAPQIFVFIQDTARVMVTFTAFLIPLLVIWPPMALLLLVAIVPAVIAQVGQSRRRAALADVVVATYRRQFFYRSLLTDPGAAKELRLFGFAPLMHRRMIDALSAASSAELAVERRAAIVQAVIALGGAAVTGVGVVVVVTGAADGRFSVGEVAFFLAAVAGLESTLAGLVSGAGHMGQHLFLFSRYLDVIRTQEDFEDGTRRLGALSEGIEMDDVWFRYDEDGPWVLRGVSLSVPAGVTVGVVGLNGAGKSTLVKLLCRFYDPERGDIRWDGVDIRDFRVADLRRRIGVTFQDYMTYELSAAENIGLGDLDRMSDHQRLREVAELAEVDKLLGGLPNGYDTMLSRTFFDEGDGSRGVTLSGGQWQRVALARALMRTDADLLMLDEPSSGLDAQAEHRIHEAIMGHGVGRTRLLVSHRLAALRSADIIVVLSDGRVVERGSHDELMAADGEYARLFRLQARHYQDERVLEGLE